MPLAATTVMTWLHGGRGRIVSGGLFAAMAAPHHGV